MDEAKGRLVGREAPDFTLETLNGGSVSLSDFRGKKVWLAFFRYASCPMCNLRISDIIRRHGEFAGKGLKILAVFQSPRKNLARYVGRQKPPFPLLSDPEETAYGTYGLGNSLKAFVHPMAGVKLAQAATRGFLPGALDGTKTRIPGDFLIDETGVVVDEFHGGDIGQHIPFERVDAFLGD